MALPQVPFQQILNQLHSRYAQTITTLMQENAEAAAGLDALSAENDDLRARLIASESGRSLFDDAQRAAAGVPPDGWEGTQFAGRPVADNPQA